MNQLSDTDYVALLLGRQVVAYNKLYEESIKSAQIIQDQAVEIRKLHSELSELKDKSNG